MKKILSILVSVALLASACSLFFTAAAEDTDANAFKAQHLDIDFSKYSSDLTSNTTKNFYLGDYNQWSIKSEGENNYLSFNVSKDFQSIPAYSSFMLSTDGKMNYSFNKVDGKYFVLSNGGVYRLSLKYRLKVSDSADSLALGVFSYKNSSKAYLETKKVVNSSKEVISSSLGIYQDITSINGKENSSKYAKLDTTENDEWANANIIFNVDTIEDWKNAIALQLRTSTGQIVAGEINFDIDDIKVDRLATVNVNGVPSYKIAPPCDYSKYLFSGTGEFDGDTDADITSIINASMEIYDEVNPTATVTVGGALYSDSACTNEITDANGLLALDFDENGVYNCYQKINTDISKNQFAFVGFDKEPGLRNDINEANTFTASWKADDSGFSIVNNEAYTGNSSLKFDGSNKDGSRKLYIGNGYEYEVGKGYKISFYTKRVYNNTKSYEISAFAGNGFDETEQGGTKSVTVKPSDDWTKYEIIYYLGDDVDLNNPNKYYAPGLKLSDEASSLYIDAITISEYKNAGDVNGDEKIDICDLVGINEYINNNSYRMIADNAKLLNTSSTEIDTNTFSALRTKLLG